MPPQLLHQRPLPDDQVQRGQATSETDLRGVYELVSLALTTLPENQQQYLRAAVVEGRKPSELAEYLNLSLSEVEALGLTAKGRLRAATLQIALGNGAPKRCRDWVMSATTQITPSGMVCEAVQAQHASSCLRCAAAQSYFNSSVSELGVCTVLAAGALLFEVGDMHARLPLSRHSNARAIAERWNSWSRQIAILSRHALTRRIPIHCRDGTSSAASANSVDPLVNRSPGLEASNLLPALGTNEPDGHHPDTDT
ncbi:hypothetical protein QFZ53_001455 [Microbacterium natoriense]|uniref:RNA polymerase sigma factor 70 region 4 type 2 domain-containing protein n=1 Tax=Microbacterium natoriense TaxID=284570 RepID=A0AAW8EWK8_9MICO|nr:hypothetical protein [Microbacterium natoriense]